MMRIASSGKLAAAWLMRALALAGLLLGSAVAAVAASAPASAQPAHVGLVINGYGTCVPWTGGTGYDVLYSGADVVIAGDPAHRGMVAQINSTPATAEIDATHYWSYWRNTGNGWVYSGTGGSNSRPSAGTVEGWSYVDGSNTASPPTTMGYDALCGARDPQPAAPEAPAPQGPAPASESAAPPPVPPEAGQGSAPPGAPGSAPQGTQHPGAPSSAGATEPSAAQNGAGDTSGSTSAEAQPDMTPLAGADAGPTSTSPSTSASGGTTAAITRTSADARSSGGGALVSILVVGSLVAVLAGGAVWQSRRRAEPDN